MAQVIRPDRQHNCQQEHKFYFRVTLLVYLLLKLMPLDRSRDIRVWWWANWFRLSMFMFMTAGACLHPGHRQCMGEWMKPL
eukprot:scaffold644646_cov53-Prasinocladus_malaysianus.AAC.1